jgi:hypothetical protein
VLYMVQQYCALMFGSKSESGLTPLLGSNASIES